MSQNLSSAAVVIASLKVKYRRRRINLYLQGGLMMPPFMLVFGTPTSMGECVFSGRWVG